MKSFRYDFTMKELGYFIFSKKNCPKCGNKMKKNKGYEMVDGKILIHNQFHYLFKEEMK